MAKIRHNNFIDTVAEISNNAKREGVVQLYTEDDSFSGRSVTINGTKLLHFGTTGYLGLEQNQRLKQAAADAVMRFGTQFPLSKLYVSHTLYAQLEARLQAMYGAHVLVTKNSTLGHLGVLPSLVRDEDGVILDHQVHWSVQNAVQLLKPRGVSVEMIKHSDLDMLESKIKLLSQTCKHIWYLADGVYSMFGDVAPIEELKRLNQKYPQLHIYYDDVHGMSWAGKNGTGYVISQYGELPENVIVMTTLSKSFGASGATMITTNQEVFNRVKSFGGPLTFSAQLEPASVAAAIASADIHLSDEIVVMQQELSKRITFCNELLAASDLPLIDNNSSPVFYIGTGAPAVGFNFTRKLYQAGFYANMGLFPAVPVKKTGIRFTISLHNELEDVELLVKTMSKWYPKALEEEGYHPNQIRRIFKLRELEVAAENDANSHLKIESYESIEKIDEKLWNRVMGRANCYDYNGMKYLEAVFYDNQQKEHNWDFRYCIVKDQSDEVVLATFFTNALWKDDMLSPPSVSGHLEVLRKTDPYVNSSFVLMMGSLFTEGNHLYLNDEHPLREDAFKELLKYIDQIDAELKSDVIALRDFDEENSWIISELNNRGFVKVALPDASYFDLTRFKKEDQFTDLLSSKSRKHFRKDVEPFVDSLVIEVAEQLTKEEMNRVYELYGNVWSNNIDMNTFKYPIKMLEKMNAFDGWEFILARDPQNSKIVGVMLGYKNQNTTYCPALVGMDYTYTKKFSVYRQMLYQTVERGRQLGYKKIDFGFSASFEKQKMGAVSERKFAYLQAKDNYSLEMIEIINA